MKVIQQVSFAGIDAIRDVEIPDPKLSPMTALVETAYVPVLPWDVMTEKGDLQNMRPVQLPLVIGYGFSGVVSKVGALRSSNLIGQRVIGANPAGAMQERIASNLPPLLFKVPDNVRLRDAATLIGGADAALMAVNTMQVSSGDTVLVTGASGGVGTYLIQLLKMVGAHVEALASPPNFDFLKKLGVDDLVDYSADVTTQLANLPHANKVIDTVGRLDLLEAIIAATRHFNLLSLSTTTFPEHTQDQTFQFANGSIGLNGYKRLLNWLSDGTLQAHVQTILPVEQIKQAQHQLVEEHSHGRILIKF